LLQKEPKHARPKRGGVTQGFLKGLLGPTKAAQRGSEKLKEVTKKKKERNTIFSQGTPQRGLKGLQWAREGPLRGSGSLKKQKRKQEIT
jgi:hypothetical protein